MKQSRRVFLAAAAGLVAMATDKGMTLAQAHAEGQNDGTQQKPQALPKLETFQARSADGTVLMGDVVGDREAPEILFVHGLRQSRLSWDRQITDPTLAGFRMVRFDLRGHGDSDKPFAPEAYSEVDRWAEDIAAVIAQTGLRRPIIVGWSLGGFAAGAYLRKYGGGQVAGFNLVDALIKLSPDLLTPVALQLTGASMASDLAQRTTATVKFFSACFHHLPTGADLQQMLVINGMSPRAVTEGFLKSSVTDFEGAFQAYNGPILLTHGKHDQLVRVAMSENLKAVHGQSRLSIFADSGHSPFYEEPARFGRELAAFIKASNHG